MTIELTRIKKNRVRKRVESRWGDRLCRIWSAEWGLYWRPNGCGYTVHPDQIGIYTLADALRRSGHCGPEKHIFYELI